MKIGFIHHSMIIGSGIDTVIWEIASRLCEEHDVEILTFNSEYSSPIIREIRFPFKKNRVINGVFNPVIPHTYSLRRHLDKFDAINVHHYPANIIPFFPSRSDTFIAVTEWSGPPSSKLGAVKFHEKLYMKLIRKMNKIAALKADGLIAPCPFVKRWIKENYGLDSEQIYLDGINFQLFNREYDYRPINFMDGYINILYVGRVAPHKNIECLIESFQILKEYIDDVRLIIVGRRTFPVYYKNLMKILRKKGLEDDVIFTGKVSWEELPRYYSACDIYATCSLWEGFLRAEAFAMGKPMVAFDVGANSDTIHNGKNGILVKEKSSKAFAEGLIRLASDENLRKKMGERGYKWAKENLDFNVIAKNFSNYLEEAISCR
ncbi:galactosyl-transferase RfpB-like protein [Methanothermobacter tenebrarum]|uniref:Galactosyl-transferase RfpB-like protein n=1 Tax=Methanothermobacter tenebrarum TaxID=680118 RepID=A0ABM7YCX2_9EURY|nr:glycosyltransferase family 4 protein [Methanothermobacter tenebrarum]MDI6882043.1 glycosyltransferase family 4 protein [Methanothermobacter sp.]MDX9692852.1 glycosyltransferase family 4 protein [Methanothermobacter sp.]BDH79962.1 galactosyl-transferase RfpB-like protein [Methanothermobacter tenebrarum]HOQ19759.1 glycosyltransferase family 4 protein [Methanothermobacter sp.]